MELWAYLKRQWKLLLLLIGIAAVFAAVFSLYDLPVEAVGYGAALCLVLGAVLFTVGFWRFRSRHRELRRLLFCATGALLSPTSTMQGESIPGVCHAVILENIGEES